VKIALSGSASTGKTTLANAISEKLNILAIPEFAREVAKDMKVKNLREMTPLQSFEFQTRVFERKKKLEEQTETFIADRSTADNLAYYLRWACRDIEDGRNKAYVDWCINHLKTYDLVVLLPWNAIPLEDDGFRSAKVYYQYEIHCLTRGILVDNNIKHYIMTETDPDERVLILENLFTNNICPACGKDRGPRPVPATPPACAICGAALPK